MDAEKLLDRFPIISKQVDRAELQIILKHLQYVLSQGIEGAICEFGCYSGTTSLFIERLLQGNREFHVYDSFAGLPEKTAPDNSPAGAQFKAGELSISKAEFIANFKKAGLRLPRIHKAWFSDLGDEDVPQPVALAFLDGDYYESIRTCLKLIDGKLSPRAVIIVDDYMNEALPGAATAVDDWLLTKTQAKLMRSKSLAIITLDAKRR